MNWQEHHTKRMEQMAKESRELRQKVKNPDAYRMVGKENDSAMQITGFNNSKSIRG